MGFWCPFQQEVSQPQALPALSLPAMAAVVLEQAWDAPGMGTVGLLAPRVEL